MEPIIYKFGTPAPVKLSQGGEEYQVRAAGSAVVSGHDGRWPDGANVAPYVRMTQLLIQKCFGQWPQDVLLCTDKCRGVLAAMLEKGLAGEGITAKVTVVSLALTEESGERYLKKYSGRAMEDVEKLIPKASAEGVEDVPHGPLKCFTYSRVSHGMMMGTSSGVSETVDWYADGTVTLSRRSYGGGKADVTRYDVTPEAAGKLKAYVADSRLEAFSRVELPPGMMGMDSVVTASFGLKFDDSSLGGSSSETVDINCGMSGMFYRDIEKAVSAILEECVNTGRQAMTYTEDIGGGILADMVKKMENPARGRAAAPSRPKENRGPVWKCSICGNMDNWGKFCTNCGEPRPAPSGWACHSCGYMENTGKFCANCGARRPV